MTEIVPAEWRSLFIDLSMIVAIEKLPTPIRLGRNSLDDTIACVDATSIADATTWILRLDPHHRWFGAERGVLRDGQPYLCAFVDYRGWSVRVHGADPAPTAAQVATAALDPDSEVLPA